MTLRRTFAAAVKAGLLLVGAAGLTACGGSGDSGRGGAPLLGQQPGGGTTPRATDQIRVTLRTTASDGGTIDSGSLNMRPSERRRFVATVEDIRTPSRPRPLRDTTVNFEVLSNGTPYSDAFITLPTGTGACPSPGQFSERRGGRTDAAGEVEFCLVAPLASALEGESALPLTIQAAAFTPDPARVGQSIRTLGRFDLLVVNVADQFSLSLTGPGGQVTESLTLDAGATLNGFIAQIGSGFGDPIPSGTFIRITNDQSIGRVITPQASGGTVGSTGRLSFGYEAGCPAVADVERVSLLGSATVNGQPLQATYDLFVRRVPATLTLELPAQTAPVFSGDVLRNVTLRLARQGGGSLSGVEVELAAQLNGNPVGAFVDPFTGIASNPLRTTVSTSTPLVVDYRTPQGLQNNQLVSFTALANDPQRCVRTQAAPRSLTVNTRGAPVLAVTDVNGNESGTLEITGATVTGFRILATDGQGRPLDNVRVTLARAPALGRLVIPGGTGSAAITNFEGLASFEYEAPAQISSPTIVTITATATIDGRNVSVPYTLTLVPPPPPPPPVLALTGPATAAPGAEQRGYRVLLTQANGVALQNAEVRLTATNGTVSIIEGGTLRPGLSTGRTDAFGRLDFAFTPASNVTVDTTASLRADLIDPRFEALCFENAQAVCSRTISVTVLSDEFRFTAPVFGTAVTVGTPNAQPLQIVWRTAQGQPVVNPNGGAPCVDLNTRFTGGGNAQFGLFISGDPTPQTQRRRVQLNSNGNFAQSVSVFADRSGFLEIEVRENRDCGPAVTGNLIATTGVQFIDEPCERSADGRDCVDLRAPLVLIVNPAQPGGAQPSVELVMEVRNAAFQPIDNAQVTFRITNAASGGGAQPFDPNERVFPGGGTTDANGLARSTYFAPQITAETTVDIEGCVRAAGSGDIEGRFCRTRRITLRPPSP